MKKIIKIGEKEVAIRGIKFKEIKEAASSIENKIDEIFEIIAGDDVIKGLYNYVLSQFDLVEELIIKFTDLKKDDVEELDITELTIFGQEFLKVNGITKENFESFFVKVAGGINKVVTEKIPEEPAKAAFVQTIPSA